MQIILNILETLKFVQLIKLQANGHIAIFEEAAKQQQG